MMIPISQTDEYRDALRRAKRWIERNCCEISCKPKKNRDPDCFSCQAYDFLESLPK